MVLDFDKVPWQLFGKARDEAIGKVLGMHLNKYDILLDISHNGLEELHAGSNIVALNAPNTSSYMTSKNVNLDAIAAYGNIDEELFGSALDKLSKMGKVCYFEDAPVDDLYEFYRSIAEPFPIHKGVDVKIESWVNDFLEYRGLRVVEQGTRQASRMFVKRDVPIPLNLGQNVPMYDLFDKALIISNVYYNISQLK